jgi:peptidoglycan/LPS O-acetylase OafA/YrhL
MGPYNWHFWSLAVEMQFYVSIAIVVLCGGRRALWIVWPACLAVIAVANERRHYSDFRTIFA